MKQTEIGLIPDDWEVKNINKECTIKARIGWQGLKSNEYLDFGDYVLITGTDFDNGFINWKSCNYVSEWRFKQDKNIQIKQGDVLITKDGTIGKVAFLDAIPMKGTLNSGVFVIRPKSYEKIDTVFLSLIFKSIWFDSFLEQITSGSTIVHLYQKDFVTFNFPIPPTLTEQQRIAKALSDVDALISTTEKLIQKKKSIKQGTMQELLTGKKRLPGFGDKQTDLFVPNGTHTKEVKDVSPEQIHLSAKMKRTELGEIPEDWEVKNINKECTIKARIGWQGLKSTEYLDSGDYILITGTDFDSGFINWKSCSYVTKWRFDQDKNIQIKQGDVLITKDGTIGKVAFLNEIPMQGTLNSGVFVIRPKNHDKIDSVFLSLIFKSIWFDSFLEQITSGSTIVHLYQKDFVKFDFPLPSKEEQTAIAKVLSSMDKEIETLNTKLEKYRNLKTAMMQQLLTGKIRLVK